MALRIAATVLVVGVLAVWLVAPIGNACPDLGRLPSGSTSSSSPSFSPPLTRQCTYTTADGTKARARYVPWLDWIVLALIAAVGATVAHFVSAPGRRPERPKPAPRERRPPPEPKPPRPQRERRQRPAAGAPDPPGRDDAARARARQERAERARRERSG
jgi:hypothetical protein